MVRSALPPDVAEWLPVDLPAGSIDAWALVGRSFDRVNGEALVVRTQGGACALLTRPERFEVFRALPLAAGDALRVDGARLAVRTIDGRSLSLALESEEAGAVHAVLDERAAPGLRVPSRPPPAAAADETRRPPDAPARRSDRPARLRDSSIRPPERADTEVVRVPRSVRPATSRPASDPPHDVARSARHESVRPPVFAPEPAPIVRSARDTEALRASFRHHFEHGALDEACQVARALAHLGLADALEQRLAQLSPEVAPSFATPLSPYLVRAFLAHDEEDAELGRVLAAIWPAYLQMRVRPDRDLGLRPGDEADLTRPADGVARLFAHASRALSLETPRLFVRTDVPGGMAYLHAMPIASLCGGTLATAFDGPSTLHVLGHHLSLYRSDAYLIALAATPQELTGLLAAALHLEGRVQASDARIVGLSETLARHMVPPVRAALRQACEDLTLPGDDPAAAAADALARHRRAVMRTAVRAGLALSGSLAVSDRMQRVMPAVPGLTLDEMLDDLVTYSVSSSWMALRKELGIALEPSGPSPPIGAPG